MNELLLVLVFVMFVIVNAVFNRKPVPASFAIFDVPVPLCDVWLVSLSSRASPSACAATNTLWLPSTASTIMTMSRTAPPPADRPICHCLRFRVFQFTDIVLAVQFFLTSRPKKMSAATNTFTST